MGRFQKVLVANRGEIAVRVLRSARELGLETVAVYSDADAEAPFVAAADEAVRLGPAPSAESYLAVDRVLAAARAVGADAIHPGYGFLAENAGFAAACEAAGVVFVGPPAEVLRRVGSKLGAKAIAAACGVATVPGDDGAAQDTEALVGAARRVGLPVLLKASAGGGGKGMRVVREARELEGAVEGARREALAAFGDGTLFVERYIEAPRHVEVQILGDASGRVVHLFERDCSVQRRHQKLIEETPAPRLPDDLRARIREAAVRVGVAAGYRNAGTVEFLVGPDGAFYFLEVNARLQVEHPVTELVTGVDLVREQLRIAMGESVGFDGAGAFPRGAAIEARLCAEDPAREFRPAGGRILAWDAPTGPGVRVDTGIVAGSEVGVHYDSLLAKIIAWGETREEARARLVGALRQTVVLGITTNRDLLIRVLEHPAFSEARHDTHLLARTPELLAPSALAPIEAGRAAIAATLASVSARRAEAPVPTAPSGFRNSRFADARVVYELDGLPLGVSYRQARDGGWVVALDGPAEGSGVVRLRVSEVEGRGRRVAFEGADGVRVAARVVEDGGRHHVALRGRVVELRAEPRFPERRAAVAAGSCVAPMPGRVAALHVSVGQRVAAGEALLVLEAMKMEHSLVAPHAGTVTALGVALGAQVEADAVLAVVEPDSGSPAG